MSSPAQAPPASASAPKRPRDSIAPGEPIVAPSPSASLVLLAPLTTRTRDGYDYRVLLLKRNAKSSTFTSAHVFPGGNIDPIDRDSAAWATLFPDASGLSAEDQRMQSMKLCAVRETFEECGILMYEGGAANERWASVSEEQRREWRTKVHKSGPSFVELFNMLAGDDKAAKIRPALSSLQYRGNWITPANMKRRFDTCFFISILPPASAPSIAATDSPHQDIPTGAAAHARASADNTEMISADWLTPLEAIQKTLTHTDAQKSRRDSTPDSIILFPPQFYLLAELVRYKSWKDVLGSDVDASGRALPQARRVGTFGPEVQSVVDGMGQRRAATVLVGDPAHSKTVDAKDGDRHRTYVLLPLKPEQKADEKWKSKAPLGLTVMGVHRQGMTRLFGPGWEDMKEGDVGEGPATSHL